MKVERLIANHPNDIRSLVNVLVQNGHIVWSMRINDTDSDETNTVVFYTPQVIEEKEWFDFTPKVLEHITKVLRSIPFEEGWEEREPSAEPETETDKPVADPMYHCPNKIGERQCVLSGGHGGDCLVKCDDPNCPGYAWEATDERPHPTNTCKPHCAPSKP